MRRKFKYYMNDHQIYASAFWRILRSCYIRFNNGYDMPMTIDQNGFNAAVHAIKSGCVIVPKNTTVVFRREEDYA